MQIGNLSDAMRYTNLYDDRDVDRRYGKEMKFMCLKKGQLYAVHVS